MLVFTVVHVNAHYVNFFVVERKLYGVLRLHAEDIHYRLVCFLGATVGCSDAWYVILMRLTIWIVYLQELGGSDGAFYGFVYVFHLYCRKS